MSDKPLQEFRYQIKIEGSVFEWNTYGKPILGADTDPVLGFTDVKIENNDSFMELCREALSGKMLIEIEGYSGYARLSVMPVLSGDQKIGLDYSMMRTTGYIYRVYLTVKETSIYKNNQHEAGTTLEVGSASSVVP